MGNDFFADVEGASGFAYAGAQIDRASEIREDAARIAGLRGRADARFILLGRDMPILARRAPETCLFPLSALEELGGPAFEVLLGLDAAGAPWFAAQLPEGRIEQRSDASDGFLDRRDLVIPGRDDLALVDLRSIASQGLVPAPLVAVLGQAKAIVDWHARHGFCAKCGASTRPAAAGWRRECDACKAQHFPRTDPVVIMLAVDGERCLMGRQRRFPKGMYSALAGFVEPGETIEEAVRREIREESGIVSGAVRYVASQPWPFPSSLMVGCLARAQTTDVHVDAQELEDARWFERAEAQAMFDKQHPDGLWLPNPMAIAHHLIRFGLGRAS